MVHGFRGFGVYESNISRRTLKPMNPGSLELFMYWRYLLCLFLTG